jgi:transcriptional/translational regulatory protein YebC/TACO1
MLSSELIYKPTEPSESDPEMDAKVGELVEALEANEDVLSVWTTID